MAKFSTIKGKINTICDNNNFINEVFNYSKQSFGKFPAATVITTGNEAKYSTTIHNERMYSFLVSVYLPVDAYGEEGAEDALVEVIDSLIDDFDQDYTLTGSALMVSATPSEWGWLEADKTYRVASINLQVKTQFNVTT